MKDHDYVIAQKQLFAELEAGGIATTVAARTDYVGKAVGLSILALVRTDIAAVPGHREGEQDCDEHRSERKYDRLPNKIKPHDPLAPCFAVAY